MQYGARVGNYLAVQEVLKDAEGLVAGVVVRDTIGGKAFPIRAKSVINATGCFGDAIRQMDNPEAKPLILGSSGVHVILPDHFSPDKMGLIIPKTKDGRVLFFLPWEGSTICGTTESARYVLQISARSIFDDIRHLTAFSLAVISHILLWLRNKK